MSTRTGILGTSGIVIGSTGPDRLAAWYRAALEPLGARWESHLLVVADDGTYIGFDRRDDVRADAAEPGRHLVNLGVRDIREAERHLNTLGVHWVRPVELTDSGAWFSTVADPDGNLLQFIQMPGGED